MVAVLAYLKANWKPILISVACLAVGLFIGKKRSKTGVKRR